MKQKHCKISYEIIVEYTSEANFSVIKVGDNIYKIEHMPRPCKNVADCYVTIVNGIKYPTFAKFLKSIQ